MEPRPYDYSDARAGMEPRPYDYSDARVGMEPRPYDFFWSGLQIILGR